MNNSNRLSFAGGAFSLSPIFSDYFFKRGKINMPNSLGACRDRNKNVFFIIFKTIQFMYNNRSGLTFKMLKWVFKKYVIKRNLTIVSLKNEKECIRYLHINRPKIIKIMRRYKDIYNKNLMILYKIR